MNMLIHFLNIKTLLISTVRLLRCMVDMRKPYGTLVTNMYGLTMATVFCVNVLCYGAVWLKIRRVAMTSPQAAPSRDNQGAVVAASNTQRYLKTAKMMMVFVGAYLLQWSSYVVQAVWSMVGVPRIWLFILTVIMINLGGVYNALAYTIIRRYMVAKKPADISHSEASNQTASFTTGVHNSVAK